MPLLHAWLAMALAGVPLGLPMGSPAPRATQAPMIERLVTPDSSYQPAPGIRLPPGTRSFEFHFAAPPGRSDSGLLFRYMLEGFDERWVNAGQRQAAYYTNVPPGAYRFHVGFLLGDGDWSESEATLAVVVTPRFFERPWFLLLSAWVLIAGGVALYRARIRTLTRRQEELEKLMAERSRTERALRISEERLRLALEAGRMGTWEWDVPTGRITTSQTTTVFFGFAPSSVEEVLSGLEDSITPEDYARLAAVPDRLQEGHTDIDLHFPVVSEDGLRRHVELRGQATLDTLGRPVRVAGIVADVTEFMDAQEELRHREEELRQAQKMEAVGRLAGGVAHDFNNLLTAISGRTHIVLESLEAGDDLRQDIEEIRDAAQRAANLTQQLLTFSRKQIHQPRILDLNGVVGGVERMLRRLIREDVVLETTLAPDLRAINADPGALEQVLVNLVVNSQDAMPEGGRIRIETRQGRLSERPAVDDPTDGGDWNILSVSDTGIGMSAETQKQVFEPFFTTKPIGKGTGLGLATVYGIVQQSGGHIRLASQVGRGTLFQIFLPAVKASGPHIRRAGADAAAATGSETILLAEDEPAVRSLVKKILERRGYTVVDAPSGMEALEICRADPARIDMLVSDVVMPHLGGRELAEQVLLMAPHIRVLLMSGYNEDEVLRRGVPVTGMDFIQKPFEPDAFARRVRAILDAEVRA